MGRIPTISISSPVWITPCSTLPVTTVPRPVIENTSSIGIRNGLSRSRVGSGTKLSTASISASTPAGRVGVALQRLQRRHPHDRGVVARELVLGEQLPDLQLHQLQQLLVIDLVDLVQRHHDRRHPHLAGQQHVLTGLGHRTIRGRHHQDRPIHLRRAGDHVLDVVSVTRHVDMRVVTVVRLVLHMGDVDRDPPLLLLRRLVDLIEGHHLHVAVLLRQHLGDRRRQRRLPMVDVAHRPHVQMRLVPIELLLGHDLLLFSLGGDPGWLTLGGGGARTRTGDNSIMSRVL